MPKIPPSIDSMPAPKSYKRNLLIEKLARAPWWVLVAIGFLVAFIGSVSTNTTYQEVWGQVQKGIGITLYVSVIAYSIALVMAVFLAILRLSRNVVVYQVATFFVEVVRGIPTLVIVYYIVLALVPELVRLVNELGVWLLAQNILPEFSQQLSTIRTRDIDNTYRAIAGLAISYSAFLSEIIRAGIESIPRGQWEAGMSLGMTRRQVLINIILPQAFRNVLPPLANDFIAMLKESSLVSIVGVQDITRSGATYASANFTFFQSYNVIALTYLSLTLTLSLVVKAMETYLKRGQNRD